MASNWLKNMPWRIIVTLFVSQFSQSCGMSALIGYLPPLIHRFGIHWVDVGIYKGMALSLCTATYTASLLAAGCLIDYIGRVKFFIACTLTQAVVMVTSAFVYNMACLFTSAILIGFVSCNRIAAKLIAFQISNPSIESKVINYGLFVPFNMGLLLGPSLGGFLVVPADQYSNLFHKGSLFDVFPALLPNILIGLLLATAFLLSWGFFVNNF